MSKKNPRNKSPLATVCKNTFLVLIEWTCLQPHHRWVLECWCLTLNSRYCNFLLDWRAVCTFCEGIPAIGLFFAKKCFFVLCPFLENTKFCLAVTSYTVFLWRLDSCSIGRAESESRKESHTEKSINLLLLLQPPPAPQEFSLVVIQGRRRTTEEVV